MKITHKITSSTTVSGRPATRLPQRLTAVLAILAIVTLAPAAVFVKTNNVDALNLGSSWTNGAAPGAADLAQWDNTVTDPNDTTNTLGASLTWGGIRILNPAAAITIITNTGGNTLTLGGGGIDLSAATASLTLSNNVVLLANTVQPWTVAAGQTLALAGTFTRQAGAEVRFNTNALTGGTINLARAVGGNGGNPGTNVLNYTLVNGTDVGALDASQNLSTVNAVVGYSGNVAGGAPTTAYMDVVNGNTGTAADVAIGSTSYTASVVRFNTPQPNRNYWLYAVAGRLNYVGTQSTYLVTTNVGAQDVLLTGTAHTFRWNNGSELILDQENTAGTFYVDGPTSQRIATANNILTKYGPGRVVFNGNTANNGPIRILEGELMLNGSPQPSSVVTVNSGATLSGFTTIGGAVTNYGGTIHPGTTNGFGTLTLSNLTLNGTSSLSFYSAALPATNTVALLDLAGGFAVNGAVNVFIGASGSALGQYPLVKWTNAISAAVFTNFNLAEMPLRTSGYLSNNVADNSIDLVVTNVNEPVSWAVGNGNWDVNATANWVDTFGAATTYQQVGPLADDVLFGDAASGTSPITVTLNVTVTPASVTVNNTNKNYILSGSGGITGGEAVTKTGPGAWYLQTTNFFAGGFNLNGGIVNFTSLSNLGVGGLNFGGGTLQYAAGTLDDISVLPVTFGAGGGTIDDGGNTLTFANSIGNNGVGGFTKSGLGSLTLNGTNLYAGNTVITGGTLALAYNTFISNSAAIIVNAGGLLDTFTSGVNLTLNPSASQQLAGAGSVSGTVTAPTGTSLSPATTGVYGMLTLSNDLYVSGATLIMDISPTSQDLLAVTGNLMLSGGTLQLNVTGTLPNGVYKLIQYGGSLLSGAGSSGNLTILGFSQTGQSATLSDAKPNEIDLIVAASANDLISWSGTGSTWDLAGTADWLLGGVTAWSYTNGDQVTFDDTGAASPSVSLSDSLLPGLVTVSNNVVAYVFTDGTGTGGGRITGRTALVKDGSNSAVFQTANNYSGSTTIKNGTLQIGAGGIGDIGTGNVTNNGSLIFGQGDNNTHTVAGLVAGTGTLTQQGNSTVVLAQGGSYSGATTITAGTLELGNGGTASLPAGNVTNNGTLILNCTGTLTLPGTITGSGALATLGTASLTLGGSMSYLGNTFISNGVVKLSGNNQIPDGNSVAGSTGWLILDGGATAGTFDMNGFDETINSLSGLAGTVNGVITNGSTSASTTNILTLLNTASTTYAGQIADHAGGAGAKIGLFVTGPGTLALTPANANTFSGGIIISNSAVTFVGSSYVNGNAYGPGTGPITLLGTNASLVMCGSAGDTTPTYAPLTNLIVVPAGQLGTVYGPSRGNCNSPLLGGGTLQYNTTYVRDWVGGDWSAFTGNIILSGNASGGNIGLTITNGFPKAVVTINTNVALYATVAGTPTVPIGALAGGDGSCQIESTSSGGGGGQAAIFAIGGLNASTAYGGRMVDNVGLLKIGTGTFTLNGGANLVTNITTPDSINYYTNVSAASNFVFYTGSTVVSNGTLALILPVVLTNSTTVTLAAPAAVLDASAMGYVSNELASDGITITNAMNVTNSLFEVVSGQSFNGVGTLIGNLQADAGSVLNPGNVAGNLASGSGTGLLTVSGSATLNGTLNLRLNTANAAMNDELAAAAYAVSGSTLVVTNVGPALAGNHVFHLFSSAVDTNGFVAMTLPPSTSLLLVSNNLAVDGTLVTLSLINTNAATANFVATPVGNTLQFTWAPDHQGWQLYTNAVGLNVPGSWFPVSGSASVTNETITIDPANPNVFYQLRYP